MSTTRGKKALSSSSPSGKGTRKDETMSNTTKTLSRRQIYLPMIALDNSSATTDPQTYMASRTSLPSNIQESNLVEFWHKIGVTYHHVTATVHDPKNNGHKPVSLQELDSRIRQKALTLVGGGINSEWAASGGGRNSATKDAPTTTIINAKVLNVRRDRKKRKRQIMKSAMKFTTHDEDGRIGRFLLDLNDMWNTYISKLLQLPPSFATIGSCIAFSRSTSFLIRATSCITKESVQLVGARVQIKSCLSHPSWNGKTGILVRQTTNTWQVMVSMPNTRTNSKKRKRDKQLHEDTKASTTKDDGDTSVRIVASELKSHEETISKTKQGLKTLIVPKHGSSLTLLIPLAVDEPTITEAGSGKDKVNNVEMNRFILTIDILVD